MSRTSTLELEISTLLHGCSSQEDTVHSVYREQELNNNHQLGKGAIVQDVGTDFPTPTRQELTPASISVGTDDEENEQVVKGADLGDLPTEYVIRGLYTQEMPVIGTCVDRRITPGFRYQVRLLGEGDYLFNAKALPLQSVGIGYGKRITFKGECSNYNNNYFYSDTHPNGYGFKLVVVDSGDKFVILSPTGCSIGEVQVKEVLSQCEISTLRTEDGAVEKRIKISMLCRIDYSAQSHRMLPIWVDGYREITGMAVVTKNKNCPKANLLSIEHVEIPLVGSCILEAMSSTY